MHAVLLQRRCQAAVFIWPGLLRMEAATFTTVSMASARAAVIECRFRQRARGSPEFPVAMKLRQNCRLQDPGAGMSVAFTS